jgi:DNA modification methylase
MEKNIIYSENCETGLKTLPDNSIDCSITSPPYFFVRRLHKFTQKKICENQCNLWTKKNLRKSAKICGLKKQKYHIKIK